MGHIANHASGRCGPGSAGPQRQFRSELDLLRDGERIVDLDPEIANGALQLGVAEEQLHGSQVTGLPINLSRLRSAQRMRAVGRTIKTGALHPSMDDAGVLPRREMRPLLKTAREQVSTPAGVESGQPLTDRAPGLLGDLKLNRPPGLLLDHGRAIANAPADEYVVD